jgi:MFS family permease
MTDRTLIYTAGLLRGLAAGLISVLAAVYLAKRGFPADEIGAVLSAGMAGVATGTVYGTFWADRVGRRRSMVGLALLGGSAGLVLAWAPNTLTLVAASFFGMLNTQGTDRGAVQALETAILPSTALPSERTRVYAWYNALQDIGGALGALAAALPQLLREGFAISEIHAYSSVIVFYALLLLAAALLYSRLSIAARPSHSGPLRLSAETRAPIRNFAWLSALDAFGGGFIGAALIAYFFYERFGVSESSLAMLFVAGRTMTVFSHFAAAWLASRIGLVNTMVFTHIPSSLLLLTIPFTGSFEVAAILFILREGLSEMDVPTRQSYLMAIVKENERAYAAGITQLARAAGRVIAPAIAGAAMANAALWFPLAAGAGLKIVYDLLMWRAFSELKPPEEQAGQSQ